MKTIYKPEILTSHHVAIYGMNGSGKTVLAETYLAGYENVLALDTKGMLEWKQAGDVPVYENLDDLIKYMAGKKGKAIYRPRWEEMNSDYYNGFFEFIYKRMHTIGFIDETFSLYEKSKTTLPYHSAILTRGRQRNTALWQLTQRPKSIPLVCLSEAYHHFTFDLNLKGDRERVYEIVEQEEIKSKPSSHFGEYSFWYWNMRMDNPIGSRLVLKGVKK